MTDGFDHWLNERVTATIWEASALLFGCSVAVDHPLTLAYTDLLEWEARRRRNLATWLDGFLLWQAAIDQIDEYGADSAGEVAA